MHIVNNGDDFNLDQDGGLLRILLMLEAMQTSDGRVTFTLMSLDSVKLERWSAMTVASLRSKQADAKHRADLTMAIRERLDRLAAETSPEAAQAISTILAVVNRHTAAAFAFWIAMARARDLTRIDTFAARVRSMRDAVQDDLVPSSTDADIPGPLSPIVDIVLATNAISVLREESSTDLKAFEHRLRNLIADDIDPAILETLFEPDFYRSLVNEKLSAEITSVWRSIQG